MPFCWAIWFDSTGNFQFTFGSLGTGNGEFNEPGAIALDATGHIYVSDTRNHRVQVFRTVIPEPSTLTLAALALLSLLAHGRRRRE